METKLIRKYLRIDNSIIVSVTPLKRIANDGLNFSYGARKKTSSFCRHFLIMLGHSMAVRMKKKIPNRHTP